MDRRAITKAQREAGISPRELSSCRGSNK